jgi:hypothetical protein
MSPNVGLEPTTLRLRIPASTDWASSGYIFIVVILRVYARGEEWRPLIYTCNICDSD